MARNAAQVQKSIKDGVPIIQRLEGNIPLSEREKYANEIEYYELNIANLTIATISGYGEFEEQEFTSRFKETFLNLNWWIDDYSTLELNLIISDRPVIMYPVSFKPPITFNGQLTEILTKQDFILSLPISPTLCFFAYKGKKPGKRLSQVIRAQNFNLVARAHSYIYTNTLMHDKFIRKYFKKQ